MASKKKVLVIEDDPSNQKIVELVLSKFSCDVKVAGNGELGLEIAQLFLPDLILMDVMMPKMSGFDVLKALRAVKGLDEIPVVVISAKASAEDSAQAIGLGATEFLTKPFRIKELQNVVERFLN